MLYQVQGGVQELLSQGRFYIKGDDNGGYSGKVGNVTWPITRTMPCLRSDDFTYTFATSSPGEPATFYCVIVSRDSSSKDIELLQEVLANATAYSSGLATAADAASAVSGADFGDTPHEGGGAQPTSTTGQREGFTFTPAAAPPPEATERNQDAASSGNQIADGILKGGALLGAGLRKAAQALSEGATSVKEKAESKLTPEMRAKVESAKESAKVKLDAVGAFAGRFASGVKAAATNFIDKAQQSEKTERVRSLSRAGVTALSQVYQDMKVAGDTVLTSLRTKVARKSESAPVSSTMPPLSTGTPVIAPASEPATGVPVHMPVSLTPPGGVAQGEPVAGTEGGYYPPVPRLA